MNKQFNFPKTAISTVANFYSQLGLKPQNIKRFEHIAQVYDAHFDPSFYQQGGEGNKLINFQEFKSFLTDTFTKLPDLNVKAETLVSSGDKVTVKVKLYDENAGVEINYLTLYHVENGKIMSRYAYSDGGF
ncbi:MAG: ester cyclase [Flavobacteriaceae bacterium]